MADFVLDLSPLIHAIDRLDEGIARYQTDTSDTQIRDGLIQRFEVTYEISRKMLKRYLEMASATPAQFDGMPFQDLIRSGNEQGLLLRMWQGISSPIFPVGLGRAASLHAACVACHRARPAPRSASRLLGSNQEVIPCHILCDWPRRRTLRDMRSKTSHTCDEAKAFEVVVEIPAFLGEAKFLLGQLNGRTA